MKNILTLLFIVAISLSSCKKESQIPDCELNDTGELQVQNLRNYSYGLYLDTISYGEIEPKEIKLITCPTGSYTLMFYTEDGYYYKTIRIRQCKTERFTFEYN